MGSMTSREVDGRGRMAFEFVAFDRAVSRRSFARDQQLPFVINSRIRLQVRGIKTRLDLVFAHGHGARLGGTKRRHLVQTIRATRLLPTRD